MQNGYDEIAQSRHGLWGSASANATGVLAERDVSHVVQLILNCPVHSTKAEQVRGSGPPRRQARDLVVHLGLPMGVAACLMHEPKDLRQARPDDRFLLQARSRVQSANVEAAVPVVNRAGTRDSLDRLERNAAAPAGAPLDC